MKRLDRFARWSVILGLACAAIATEALVYWWHTYWAQYVVQNVLPPSLWTLVGLAIAHLRLHAKLDGHHEDMKQHVTTVTRERM